MDEANDTWGSKKSNFYGRDKKHDDISSSEDDQDEFAEAMRLQKIRAKKLNRVLGVQFHEDVSGNNKNIGIAAGNVEASSDDSDLNNGVKLGDKLFQ